MKEEGEIEEMVGKKGNLRRWERSTTRKEWETLGVGAVGAAVESDDWAEEAETEEKVEDEDDDVVEDGNEGESRRLQRAPEADRWAASAWPALPCPSEALPLAINDPNSQTKTSLFIFLLLFTQKIK